MRKLTERGFIETLGDNYQAWVVLCPEEGDGTVLKESNVEHCDDTGCISPDQQPQPLHEDDG